MHVLARNPAPHPFKLDLRDTANIKHKIVGEGSGAMDDVLSQINEAFRLVRELMSELPASQNDPAYLAERCNGIVRAYIAAIRMLQPSHGGEVATQQPPPFADDLLRRWRPDHEVGGGTANPFLGSPSSQLGFNTLAEAFGARAPEMLRTGADVAGTSSGGPVRRVTQSSRGSPPIQPRPGRRRYVLLPLLGVTLGFVNFCGQEFKPRLRPFTTSLAWKGHRIFHARISYLFADCDADDVLIRIACRVMMRPREVARGFTCYTTILAT